MCRSLTFVRGTKPARNTGFDMDEDDLLEMEQCHGVVVASAIFGLYLWFLLSFRCLIWHVADELYLLFRKF